jgi:hypothetical protein
MYLSKLKLGFYHHILIITFLPCHPHTSAYYPQWLPSQHALPQHSLFLFPLISSNSRIIYEDITHKFLLFTLIHHPTIHIPHSILSLVVRSRVEPKLTIQKVLKIFNSWYFNTSYNIFINDMLIFYLLHIKWLVVLK